MGSREFFKVVQLSRALAIMAEQVPLPALASEPVPLDECLGRYLARKVTAPEDVPPFNRSIMDGFAVRAADTFGATAGSPAYLEVAGEVKMGSATDLRVDDGQAVAIPTGGMLPAEADAVVMMEHTSRIDDQTIEVVRPVATGENIVTAAEDFKAGAIIMTMGQRLRPQDLGALAALGVAEVEVFKPVRVGILSTGDEIVDVDAAVAPGQLRDVNYYSIAGLVRSSGSEPVRLGICPDDAGAIRAKLAAAVESCDIVIVSGGSSVGAADIAPEVIDGLGEPGILVHGLAVKPGKPTILAVADGVPVFGLPGHPVSAFDIYNLLVDRLIGMFYGGAGNRERTRPLIKARLGRNISSVSGREDRIRVVLEQQEDGLWAQPLMGKSGLISLLVRADGVAVIPFEAEGVERGDEVHVHLF
ncbi:MAG: molybdopterin molybdotransferase MoeA [Thermoleophilia bacterium]